MRKIKLLILIILSLSVYFIYQKTKNTKETILVLGDYLSIGVDSYYSHSYSYIDYYKEYSNKKNTSIKNYSKKDLTIKESLNMIKKEPSIKRELREADLLIINLGYNDLLFKLAIEEKIDMNKIMKEISINYKELQTEIRKFYKEKIIIIGYPQSYRDDYYQNVGITRINSLLEENKKEKDIYINTYILLKNRKEYFSNPNSNYPNQKAYQLIGKEILSKNT